MKHLIFVIFAVIGVSFTACTQPTLESTIQPKWENKHRNDPNLAGIEIAQLPEGAATESKTAFLKGHPAMILYFFWDGKVRQTGFEADGRLVEDFFWPYKITDDNGYWKSVDFSFGSDPSFIKHRDPRLPKK
jgi:hypothetical protein